MFKNTNIEHLSFNNSAAIDGQCVGIDNTFGSCIQGKCISTDGKIINSLDCSRTSQDVVDRNILNKKLDDVKKKCTQDEDDIKNQINLRYKNNGNVTGYNNSNENGICYLNDKGEFGIKLFTYGKCIPIGVANNLLAEEESNEQPSSEKDEEISEESVSTDNNEVITTFDTDCYPPKTDLNAKCEEKFGIPYGLFKPNTAKCKPLWRRGTCVPNYYNGYSIPQGSVTKCIPITDDFNSACQDMFSHEHGAKKIEYNTCPSGLARAVCATNYYSEIPIYGKSTECKPWKTNFFQECKNKYGLNNILVNKGGYGCKPQQGRGICKPVVKTSNLADKTVEIYNNNKCPLIVNNKNIQFDCTKKGIADKFTFRADGANFMIQTSDKTANKTSDKKNNKCYIEMNNTSTKHESIINCDENNNNDNINKFEVSQNFNGSYNIAGLDKNADYCYLNDIGSNFTCNIKNSNLIFKQVKI